MKDPNRIESILTLIKEIWQKYPDLRFCQLLGNCFEYRDFYYVEDDYLVNALKATYNKKYKQRAWRKLRKTKE